VAEAVPAAAASAGAGVPVPSSSARSGWGRAGHRRAVLIGALVFAIVVGGGVAAWAEVGNSTTGYRMARVTKADIDTSLTVVGSVAPVSQAAAAFQVGGKVTTIWVTPGQLVTAGETIGTLDTTALSETVSSDESALSADEAKLAEDEANQSGTGSSSPSNGSNGSTGANGSTTTTTAPGHGGSGTPGSGGSGTGTGTGTTNPTITKDQNTLTQDQAALSKAQQQEAADLTQAQSDCTTANTSTPSGQATCESALETVQADEQAVSTDQTTVSKDETALAQALAAESSGGGTGGSSAPSGNSGSPTAHGILGGNGSTGNTGNTGNTGTGSSGSPSNGASSSSNGSNSHNGGSSGNTDTPAQIASDQAAIDTAQANLVEAQQSLKEATLTSPISGTVVSVAIKNGDTVSAGSSTEIITILGTNSYEVTATLDSSQIPSVKVGQSALVEVDGVDGNVEGTVSQVGPVQSTSSGFSYPVVVALPATSSTTYAGSSANVTITTGDVSHVVAVPTSAVQTLGTRTYVVELSKGVLIRKFIKVGMVGDVYTQVDSGLSLGQSVVLVDYAEAVPSSNTNSNGLGNFLGGGGSFPGGGVFNIRPGVFKSIGGGSGPANISGG
jgi:multidrug efflux pump subunit AcrA (membrane-fusion protein)